MDTFGFPAMYDLVNAAPPQPPLRADFSADAAFTAARLNWANDALDDAYRRLAMVSVFLYDLGVREWGPTDLAEVAMLRSAVAHERMVPAEAREFSDEEVAGVEARLDRLNPEVSVVDPENPERVLYWGFAADAHVFLEPGVYRGQGIEDDAAYRVVVGRAAWYRAGEASAAFPIENDDEGARPAVERARLSRILGGRSEELRAEPPEPSPTPPAPRLSLI